MKTFNLPDLGEGLPDAEIVEWHVKEGDLIKLDAPLVSMETAKAVVDVPSPYTGTVVKLFGGPGDVIVTGSPLAGFELAEGAAQRALEQLRHDLARRQLLQPGLGSLGGCRGAVDRLDCGIGHG